MKFAIYMLVVIYAASAYASENQDTFTVKAKRGYAYNCDVIISHDNKFIVIAHLLKILETQKAAKAECEAQTGKICGIINWDPVMGATDEGGEACFPQATATPIKK